MRPRPLPPTFRNRLRLFFVVIVVIPMVAVALVLFRLVSASEGGKTDARLAQAQRSAQGIYGADQDRAAGVAGSFVNDQELSDAIRARASARVQRRLDQLVSTSPASRVVLDL